MDTQKQYGVTFIQVKVKDARSAAEAAMAAMKCGNKPYIQLVPDDGLMVQASVIDEWLMKSIDIWRTQGYDPCIQTGKPGGGGCPPGGCT